MNKITPNIWYHTKDGKMAEVITYYKEIFGNDFSSGQIAPLGQTPSGYSEMVQVEIFGKPYSFMSSGQLHHPLNDAISFIISCDDQKEIDLFWNYFTKEGEESQCGWCVDKFGLRWQIIPKNMGELMSKPGAWEVMLEQKKIIIAQY